MADVRGISRRSGCAGHSALAVCECQEANGGHCADSRCRYLGSSPFDAPGTYTLLQWTETCEGIWYPKGGFHAVIQSIVDIAMSLPNPAKFHFSSPVDQVLYDKDGKTTGIRLSNGEVKHADAVVVNADLVWAHNNLFKKDQAEKATKESANLLNP